MKRIWIVLLFCVNYGNAQGLLQVGILGGGSGYSGDLTSDNISLKTIRGAGGVQARYIIGDYISIRGGINYSRVGAKDKESGDSSILSRNLSFETNILEANVVGEVNLLSPEVFSVYPYLFLGVGYFHFNPYTYDNSGKKVYLRPLSTEGEGLPGTGKKMYSLNQICIPLGAGFKWNLSQDFTVGFELGLRKLFTDYLDDVSTRYPNYNELLTDRGIEAVSLSYRGTGDFPSGRLRGNYKKKDTYYTFGLNLFYSVGNEEAKGKYGNPGRLY
ncbi:MAG TPA: DUF6089 family protein [Puia sp.]|nr:DUF6089 family protein [Puia sp.]